MSLPNQMLWFLKRIILLRRSFWAPNTNVKTDGYEINNPVRHNLRLYQATDLSLTPRRQRYNVRKMEVLLGPYTKGFWIKGSKGAFISAEQESKFCQEHGSKDNIRAQGTGNIIDIFILYFGNRETSQFISGE